MDFKVKLFDQLVEVLETDPFLKMTFEKMATKRDWLRKGGILALGVAGGVLFGPLGAAAGLQFGKYKRSTASPVNSDYDIFIKVLKTFSEGRKVYLVELIEELIGSCSINTLKDYVKNDDNRKRLLNVIITQVKK